MIIHQGLLTKCLALAFCAFAPTASFSQVQEPVSNYRPVVPQSMRYTGVEQRRAGETVEALFRIYASQDGGEPLWSETQRVAIGADGKYSVVLGAESDDGLPQTVFTAGQARWLALSFERGQDEPRVLLASVPYAMKAADAETLAGLPAEEFVTQAQLQKNVAGAAGAVAANGQPGKVHPQASPAGSGTANTIPLWTTSSTLGNSALTQSGSNITAAGSLSGQSKSTAMNSAAIIGTQSAATGQVYGVGGVASSATTDAAGVIGYEAASTGQVYGVYGYTSTSSDSAAGVWGHEGSSNGAVFGVLGGTASGTDGASGVHGNEGSATGKVFGVSGGTNSITDGSAGVMGNEGSSKGWVHGVVGGTISGTDGAAGVLGTEGSSTGSVYGVSGSTKSTTANAAGVNGSEGATTGLVFGVSGNTSSTTLSAAGVNGYEGASTGRVYGVSGGTSSTTSFAAGVNGYENATTGMVFGVNGYTASSTTNSTGVNGFAGAKTGQVFGVYGTTDSTTSGAGGVFGANNATSGVVSGVYGNAYSPDLNAAGVSGWEGAQSGEVWGVSGVTLSAGPNAAGVNGYEGASDSLVAGVRGSTGSTGTGAAGVFGWELASTGQVYGVSGNTNSTTQGAAGVYGYEGAGKGSVAGVVGTTTSVAGEGIYGNASATSGNAVGVVGVTSSPNGTGGEFINLSGSGLVLKGLSGSGFKSVFTVDASGNGVLAGNLNVTGKITKGSGSFKIDDPLDPANKYLSHSFVESPDMMNVYNGNITTDNHGLATVTLPDYFGALNRDFRYQLTVIGQFAQAIVATKIANNQFVIRTSKPRVEVSWQVTGIRQDAYANANRIPVEEDKPASEQGYYLHPEVFGQPADKGVAARGEMTRTQNMSNQGSN